MKRSVLIVVLLFVAAVAAIGYFMSSERVSLAPDQIPSSRLGGGDATTTDQQPIQASSPLDARFPLPTATSTALAANWKTYADQELGFSLRYPSDAIMSGNGLGAVTFILPKNAYFHWPLLDDAKISVTVATSCPPVEASSASTSSGFVLSGRDFRRQIGTGAAAGNLYTEVAYDTTQGGICYRIDFFDHGANGAGLYVDDAALIKRYDQAHAADFARAIAVFNAMAASFSLSAQK